MVDKVWGIERAEATKEMNGEQNVLHAATFTVTATDPETEIAYVYRGRVTFEHIEGQDFTPADRLTVPLMIEWAKDELNKRLDHTGKPMSNPTHVEWIEDACDRGLEERLNPPHVDLDLETLKGN